MRGLSLVAASGGHSSSRCVGLSLSWPVSLRSTGSRCAGSVIVAHGPTLLRGMWDLPRPGLEPVSPALAGRFSTSAPPGKPKSHCFKMKLKTSDGHLNDRNEVTKILFLHITVTGLSLFIWICCFSAGICAMSGVT